MFHEEGGDLHLGVDEQDSKVSRHCDALHHVLCFGRNSGVGCVDRLTAIAQKPSVGTDAVVQAWWKSV